MFWIRSKYQFLPAGVDALKKNLLSDMFVVKIRKCRKLVCNYNVKALVKVLFPFMDFSGEK